MSKFRPEGRDRQLFRQLRAKFTHVSNAKILETRCEGHFDLYQWPRAPQNLGQLVNRNPKRRLTRKQSRNKTGRGDCEKNHNPLPGQADDLYKLLQRNGLIGTTGLVATDRQSHSRERARGASASPAASFLELRKDESGT